MKLLVHTCCAPCGAYSFEKLKEDGFNPVSFFYNPNIFPSDEYERRLNELLRFSEKNGDEVIIEKNGFEDWQQKIKGFEKEKEGGKRCEICFIHRLEKTALKAQELGFDAFTTTLTISPYKNSEVINKVGNSISKRLDIKFLEEDFKKNDGFKKTMELSKKYGFYRQNYCGCSYSFR